MGFIWDTTNISKLFLVIIIIADVVLIIFTNIFSALLLVSFGRKVRTQEATIEVGVFWSFVYVAKFQNLLDVGWMIASVLNNSAQTFRIIKACFLTMAALLSTLYIAVKHETGELMTLTHSLLNHVKRRANNVQRSMSKKRYVGKTNWNPLYSFHHRNTSVAFVCATVFCLTLVLTLPSPCLIILQRFKSSKNAGEHNDLKTTKICRSKIYLVPSMMIALVMFPVLSSFLTSSEFVHTSQHMICVLLFLPSVMLTIIGMIVFKELIRNSRLLMKATGQCDHEPVENGLTVLMKTTRQRQSSVTCDDNYV